ncbi:type IV pilus modification PilV family protein [Rubellimicrobium roseum]|nr:prepilin-type N-terminal cleavage/methylation domain-containing protein [Rubellimicrobium roseum]
MTWPSDPGRRRARRGVTLLETLVATAVLALLVGTAVGGLGRTLGQSATRTDRAWMTELARSVADEYRVTRDPALAQGRATPDLMWELATGEPATAPEPGLVEVTVSVWREGRESQAVALRMLLPEAGP